MDARTIAAAILMLFANYANAAEVPNKIWELNGFESPGAVVYDKERNQLYVANRGGPQEKTDAGFISRLSLDGAVLERRWVGGLSAPTGMAIRGSRLYVSSGNRLVVIDIATARVMARHDAPGTDSLNAVTVDSAGQVYVSQMSGNAIWKLANGKFRVWLKDANLTSPNGLKAEDSRLVFGSAGRLIEGTTIRTPTPLKTVDYDSKKIGVVGNGAPVGHIDGVEPDGAGNYLATESLSGTLFLVNASGRVDRLLSLGVGCADFTYLPDHGLAIFPMTADGKVVAYEFQ